MRSLEILGVITLYIKNTFSGLWFPAESCPVVVVSALNQDEAPALTFTPNILHKNNYQLLNAKIRILYNCLLAIDFLYHGIVNDLRKNLAQSWSINDECGTLVN